jgi:radical SAM enzyme (rSAM/lipoprotein system)
MPREDFFKALNQVSEIVDKRHTMIVLTGGEPLLRKDPEEIGSDLYKREYPWGLVTNGMLLNTRRLDSLLHAGLRAVTVSLDGMKESHNWLRGSAQSFTNAYNAIRLLPDVPDMKYDVVTCVNRRNYSELNEMKDLLISTGVRNWRIFTVFPIGRAAEHKELQLEPEEFKGLFDFIKQTRIENRIILNYGCEGFLGNYEREVRDSFFICRAGINIASILADGSIYACPNLRDNFIQGNIYQDNFTEVWQHRYKIFRDRSWTKTGICAECEFYKYCEGNGMHLRGEKTGELLFCHLNRMLEAQEIFNN